jgi:hypothetical protein
LREQKRRCPIGASLARRFRVQAVVDDCTRERLFVAADASLTGTPVMKMVPLLATCDHQTVIV